MRGAIIGDIIGSSFINQSIESPNFQLFSETSEFTDDTILIVSTADALLNNIDYKESMIKWVKKYPEAGYRKEFLEWINNNGDDKYVSGGEGAARRITPVGFAVSSITEAIEESVKSTAITHNIPVRLEASQAASVAIFMAKHGATRNEIKSYISVHFGYDLSLDVEYWKNELKGKQLPDTPVPPALAAFFQASDFEEAIRLAIYIGGPTSTIASIAGALAQAYFKHIPKSFEKRALSRLTDELEQFINQFEEKFGL